MTLPPLVGHEQARNLLARGRSGDSLPAALFLHGPPGVGKQRLGLWIGQLLVCREPTTHGPCGECRECGLALRLEHPDIHWFFPLTRPTGGGGPEALEEALEEARAEAVARFREAPLDPWEVEPPRGIYLAAVRRMRSVALRGPTEASRQLVLISRAEELGARGSSPEAANALLKLLEEPPEGTHLVLTSSRPGQVLETIRSRTVPLHAGPVPSPEVDAFIREHAGASPEDAGKATRLARGSIGRALRFLPSAEGTLGSLEEARRTAFRLLRAALRPGPERFALPLDIPPSGAQGLEDLFDAMDLWLRDLGAAADGQDEDELANPDAGKALAALVENRGITPAACGRAFLPVADARRLANGNVNPQLVLSGLVSELSAALEGTRSGSAG